MHEEDIEKAHAIHFGYTNLGTGVSVADVYDALTSDRVYKRAFSHEKAMQMILDGECGQFNPVLLQCLVNIQDRIKAGLD